MFATQISVTVGKGIVESLLWALIPRATMASPIKQQNLFIIKKVLELFPL